MTSPKMSPAFESVASPTMASPTVASPSVETPTSDTPVCIDLNGIPAWALSVRGTPIDLTQFFVPKPWTPERYRSLQRLAPAIHGEVRHVVDLATNQPAVVKVVRNSAVRPRLAGELENPLVEIGAMTYLHSNKAVHPVDLIARLHEVYQDDRYTYLVTGNYAHT